MRLNDNKTLETKKFISQVTVTKVGSSVPQSHSEKRLVTDLPLPHVAPKAVGCCHFSHKEGRSQEVQSQGFMRSKILISLPSTFHWQEFSHTHI